LLLEDYIALLRVGVLPQERHAPQRVRINVAVDLKQPPASDDLAETYNYANIIGKIESLAETHVDLLETFAVRLAENLLKDNKLIAVEIELVKLDIFENGRVGVRLKQK
jgi:dihydroneopterin aldolase